MHSLFSVTDISNRASLSLSQSSPKTRDADTNYIMLSENLAADCVYADILREKNTHALSDHYPNYIRLKVNTTNK